MTSASRILSQAKKRKVVNVVLPDGEHYPVYVDPVKSKFQEVFNQVTAHLGLRETDYFGLALKDDDEFQFLVLDEKIYKTAPKRWKSGPGEGLDGEGKALITVWFRVLYYVDPFILLREKVTRHLYYLQLKENVLSYNHGYTEEKCFQLVGYALQADFGAYLPDKHQDGYFDPRTYFPAWMVERRGVEFLAQNAPKVHSDLRQVSRTDAELKFIREASQPPCPHNLHFYHVKKKKTDRSWTAWLGICARGVEVYEAVNGGFKNWISTFLWPDIGKLYFNKKKFEIRLDGCLSDRKFTYYTGSDGRSKYLLNLCRNTHMFQMAIQPKLMEIQHLDAEDKRRYRESYIYSDARDLVANGGLVPYRTNLSPSKSGPTQRFSVISDASSNTTSGIVSDKMTISFDDSEDHCREIMIDCPPRAATTSTTPGVARNKFGAVGREGLAGLHGFKSGGLAPQNRSPVQGPATLELFKGGQARGASSGSATTPDTPSPVSSYRTKLPPQTLFPARLPAFPLPSPSSPSSPVPPTLPRGEPDVRPKPVSRSASRKESLKGAKPAMPVVQRHKGGSSSDDSRTGPTDLSLPLHPAGACVPSPTAAPSSAAAVAAAAAAVQQPLMPRPLPQPLPQPLPHGVAMPPSPFPQPMMPPLPSSLDKKSPVGTPPAPLKLPSFGEGPVTPRTMFPVPYTDRTEAKLLEGQDVYSPAQTMLAGSFGMAPPPAAAQPAGIGAVPAAAASMEPPPPPPPTVPGHPPVATETRSTSVPKPHAAQTSDGDEATSQTNHDADATSHQPSSSDDAGARDSGSEPSFKKQKGLTHINVKNQKERLHPELVEIREQSHAFSLPLITALCNDQSLMHSQSHTSSSGTLRSADSRLSRLSHETDPRRWSACCASQPGQPVGAQGGRPNSWHSEHFDLDTQLSMPQAHGLLYPRQPPPENHRSEPQNLCVAEASPALASSSSWAYALAYSMPLANRYSPELIAQQHMIPSRLTSGGHGPTEGNLNHKALKENVGLA